MCLFCGLPTLLIVGSVYPPLNTDHTGEALHEGAHPGAPTVAVLTDDHPLAEHRREEPGQGVTHRVVHRSLQAEAMGARDLVASI